MEGLSWICPGPCPSAGTSESRLGGSVTASRASLLPGPPNPTALDCSQGDTIPRWEESRHQAWCTPIRPTQHVLSLAPHLAAYNMTSPHPARATRTQKGIRGSLSLPLARHTLHPIPPSHTCALPVRPLVARPLGTPSRSPSSLRLPQISFTSSQRPGLQNSFFSDPIQEQSCQGLVSYPSGGVGVGEPKERGS